MTRASKLIPAKIQAQCQSAITTLEADNVSLNLTKTCVSDFVNDTSIKSVSFDQLKLQCNNYVDVIDSMVTINNQDIADYITLSGTVGSETLDGNVIITNEERFLQLKKNAYAREEMYKQMADNCENVLLAANFRRMADYYRNLGYYYELMYQFWQKKELLYDSIEAETSGLFANSTAKRGVINSLLSNLQGSFKLDFGYIPEVVIPSKLQVDYAMQNDVDTANGIKALNEYLIQTGKYTDEERAAILSCILKNEQKILNVLPSIIANGGMEAGNKAMEEMVGSYCRVGNLLEIPEPGENITISRGIDLPDKSAVVSSYNAWSREYSVIGCNEDFPEELCCKRLNYAIENYNCNSTEDDLLMFKLDGYDEAIFAGAMVEGYADIGDIVKVTLDDNSGFNFLILDVKSTQHTSKDFSNSNQCQNEWGHGYMLDEDTVQLSVCEFITAGKCSVSNVQDTESGAFLKERRVVSAQIVDHIQIYDK